MNTIELPVSFGEALDKLSILEIKLDKIKDERRNDVRVEFDALLDKLNHLFTMDGAYHYQILKKINLSIWEMQDLFRDETNMEKKVQLSIKVIDDNDRRFRVKAKLNNLFDSKLREQKGYKKRRAFVLPHLGLGDCFTISPAVRYLSTVYDEVTVVVFSQFYENVKLLYKDDPSIKLFVTDRYETISPRHGFNRTKFDEITKDYDKVYTLGYLDVGKDWRAKPWYTSFSTPFCFYKDAELEPSIFWKYFHSPTVEESKLYYEKIKKLDRPYLIAQTHTSNGKGTTFEDIEKRLGINRNDVLFIDINENPYASGDPNFEIVNDLINKPILFYKDLLINADYVYVLDSCLACLGLQLPIKTEHCYLQSRGASHSYHHLYNAEFGFDDLSGIRKFKLV